VRSLICNRVLQEGAMVGSLGVIGWLRNIAGVLTMNVTCCMSLVVVSRGWIGNDTGILLGWYNICWRCVAQGGLRLITGDLNRLGHRADIWGYLILWTFLNVSVGSLRGLGDVSISLLSRLSIQSINWFVYEAITLVCVLRLRKLLL
jgi:hypothetical protein